LFHFFERAARSLRGELARVWGDVPQPVWMEYDDFGQRVRRHTYRATDVDYTQATWPAPGAGDVTTWEYDPYTGLLLSKTDAAEQTTSYTYHSDRLHSRQSARGVTTTYTYYGEESNGWAGQLERVQYSDDTPEVLFGYDDWQRLRAVVDGAGSRSLLYDSQYLHPTGEEFSEGTEVLLPGLRITRKYEQSEPTTGRFTGYQVGTLLDPDAYYDSSYSYEPLTGRLASVTGPGLPGGTGDVGAYYTYHADSDLVHQIQIRDGSASALQMARTFEQQRELLAAVDTVWDPQGTPATIAHYGYTNDTLGRRTVIAHSGSAFGTAFTQNLGYNDGNELTSSSRTDGSVYARSYTYDPIGNRTASSMLEPPVPSSYLRKALNQYERVETDAGTDIVQGHRYDADGNLIEAYVAADMNCDGQINTFDVDAFVLALTNPATYASTYPGCDPLNGDINGDGLLDTLDIDLFTAYLTGHPGGTGVRFTCRWDAENRLTYIGQASPPPPKQKCVKPQSGLVSSVFGFSPVARRNNPNEWY
jgi:YD repeat-containing protein